MAMYKTSSAKNENLVNVLEKYRPTSSINFSDIVEDRTIYDQSRTEATFDPSQISGRLSTWGNDEATIGPDIDPDTVSVDDILGNSIVHEIRHMSQSRQGAHSTSIRNSLPFRFSTSQCPIRSDDLSCASDDFRPGAEFNEQMDKDEKSWEQEHAIIPQMSVDSISELDVSPKTLPKQKKLVNLPDFSMAYLGDSLSGNSDMSMGRFFLNRCGDIREMISAKSPTKHIPVALVANSTQSAVADSDINSQASSSFYADDESNSKAAPKISTTTYDKNLSVASLSTIASHLENDAETPGSFLDKLYKNKTKPLTKSNVQLLEKTLNQQSQASVKLGSAQSSAMNQEYRIYGQYEHPNDNADGMLSRMNSTKIEEQNNEWRQSKGTTSTETIGSDGSGRTLEKTYSPIKDQSPPEKPLENGINGGKNKRGRSPNPVQATDINSPDRGHRQYAQKENAESEYGKMNRLPRRLRASGQEPLDDVSSIMNNLRIKSPPTRDGSKSPKSVMLRKCETDLKPTKTESQSNEDQRRYAAQNRSVDLPKLSLPNYGLQGMRTSYQNPLDKRCNSQLSTHSEFTQHDGKFPLKSNTSELVWECVKLRKSVTKLFVIKNTSEKKLGLKIVVVGPGFQIVSGIEADSVILQGHECRTINVAFCPTVIGKAIGKIIFKPTKNWSEETERSVCLWAYGGSTALQLQGIERGPVGSSFLKMGETSSITSTTLNRSFSIYNKGPLNGVATIFIKPKTNQCINESHILIEPNKCVIRPDCSTNITVSYKLRRKDLERIREPSCEVLTIGTLEVIFGSEPNRQRIASMLTQRGSIPSIYKQLEFLVNDFPAASIENFSDFREDIDNVSDLFGCFKTSEIALTINRTNLDETQDADLSGMDESVMFRTLIEAPKPDQVATQPMVDLPNTSNDKMWEVHPKRLSMDTRNNSRKSITVQSFFQQAQTFQVDSDYREYLNFSTTSGQIKPKGEYTICIELKKHMHISPFSGVITIYFEKDCIEIPISVQPLPYEYSKY
ncbi:uncharacterized protein LOC129575454 isoform X2 [Sitodiplosis mosellana]|uniref:uncharacterized protein LOC129575454 isoform X2 n=1 Tax=Sitodiplosis mosellana TaxID=263140 RepID=UPI0024451C3C|nr:uncharacterized protein LOC129575454 isoform X2 [Sitodiplosis mosellana]